MKIAREIAKEIEISEKEGLFEQDIVADPIKRIESIVSAKLDPLRDMLQAAYDRGSHVDLKLAVLDSISIFEEVRSVAMPVLPSGWTDKPYGHSIAREMYKLWWEATFGVTQCTI